MKSNRGKSSAVDPWPPHTGSLTQVEDCPGWIVGFGQVGGRRWPFKREHISAIFQYGNQIAGGWDFVGGEEVEAVGV